MASILLKRTTLFLGDLSIFCTEDQIHSLFAPFGQIAEIRLKRDSETNRNLSYGFVKYVETEEAEKAIAELNGFFFLGRAMK